MGRKAKAAAAKYNSYKNYCPSEGTEGPTPSYAWVWDEYLWAWRLERQEGNRKNEDCQTSVSLPCCTVYKGDYCGQSSRTMQQKEAVCSSSSAESTEETSEDDTYEENGTSESSVVAKDSSDDYEDNDDTEDSMSEEIQVELISTPTVKSVPTTAKTANEVKKIPTQKLQVKPIEASKAVQVVTPVASKTATVPSKSTKIVQTNKPESEKPKGGPSKKSNSIETSYTGTGTASSSTDSATYTYSSESDAHKDSKSSIIELAKKILESRATGTDPSAVLAPAMTVNDKGVGTYKPFDLGPNRRSSIADQTTDLPYYNLPESTVELEPEKVDSHYKFPTQVQKEGSQDDSGSLTGKKYSHFLDVVKTKLKSKR